MARYKVTLTAASSLALKAKLKKLGIDDAKIEKIDNPSSRADRLREAESNFEEAKSQVEELKEEMEIWRDSLPENLQNGDKASQIEDCISALEDISGNMDSVDFSSVDFPGMY